MSDLTRPSEPTPLPPSRVMPFGAAGPLVREDRGIYTLDWQDPNATIEMDLLRTDSHGETSGEVTVTWQDPANPAPYIRTHVVLSSLTGRDRLAAALNKRTDVLGKSYDWIRMLDETSRWVLERYRTGEPAVDLADAPDDESGLEPLTDPPLLEPDGLTILFGDGGSFKSWTALAIAASLSAGRSFVEGLKVNVQRRVGYLDWEWAALQHRRRLIELAGDDRPSVPYLTCSRSIVDERDRLRRFVHDHQLDFLVIDSVGLACGGEPEKAEQAIQFCNAVRLLTPAALGVAHVTKQAEDRAPDKPFGSVFWANSARRTWYAKAAETAAGVVGYYNRKSNSAAKAKPFALRFSLDGGQAQIGKVDIREVPELDATRSTAARIRDLLGRRGSLRAYEIAEALDVKLNTAKMALKRGPFVTFTGPDGVSRWGLQAGD